jgi:class 3 adenylate cyclase
VKAHFRALNEIVGAEAVVKTIGDAVMATFPTPDRAVGAALRMRAAMRDLGSDLVLKIGIHEGPCLAVMFNERQDYFGQTVNVASRVQGLATSTSIFATKPVVGHVGCARLLANKGIVPPRSTRCAASPPRWPCSTFRSLDLAPGSTHCDDRYPRPNRSRVNGESR